ncbi:MAG: PilZ domain-containing protein [Phycisphaeraceae bacterium]|nr:PilZ domain-containing protein [Phycisphaeraceae bacterium]
MPPNRSRTERWRDSIEQVRQRGGALEVTLARGAADSPLRGVSGADLVWRVRLLDIRDDHMLVEQPAAAGRVIRLDAGLDLIGAFSIGQNRWMFHSRTLGDEPRGGLRLALPTRVERCQRRSFFRISTAELSLPRLECWPLMDPMTVAPAEIANRDHVLRSASATSGDGGLTPEDILLPEVGPGFTARLLNVSGGGLGLLVEPENAQTLHLSHYLWMRVDLRPHVPAPIAMTGRVAHCHTDSTGCIHAGVAFEFGFNAGHREFVVEQVGRCVAAILAGARRAAA